MRKKLLAAINKKGVLTNILLMIMFGTLSYLLGFIKLNIPSLEGGSGISDLREIIILISCFYFPHWIYLVGISLITTIGTPPEGSLIASFIMHTVGPIFVWYTYNYVIKKFKNLYSKGIIWIITVSIYYLVFLIPILIIVYSILGLINKLGTLGAYDAILMSTSFEIILTIGTTLVYFIFIQIEKDLREKVTWLELVINSANVSFWKHNISYRDVTYHDQSTSILDLPEKDKTIKYENWQNLIHPADREKVIQYLKSLTVSEKENYNLEYRLKSNSGAYKWVLDVGRKMKSDNLDKSTQYAGISIDITERKKNESELKLAKIKAEESERLKSEFLAQMSHEIRTPVNTIMSFAELIYSEIGNIIPEDLRPALSSIQNSGNRLIRTVDLILNVSELNVGLYSKSDTKLDIYKMLELIVFEFRHKQKDRNLEIILEHSGTDFETKLDSYSVNQIFYNIIDNAVKYTPKGIVKINILSQSNNIIVDVEDSGIGISEEFLPRIFNPFEQEEQGYTRPYEGNGLGMTLVKKYCEINNIQIFISSKQNVGTKISLIIPKVV